MGTKSDLIFTEETCVLKKLNLLLGFGFVGIGILGAFLPVLPSTIFFIIATYFFGKSSTRFEQWMLNHPRFGYTVRSWQDTKSIPFAGKVTALFSMFISSILIVASPASILVTSLSLIVLAACALYVWSRPTLQKQG